MDSLAAAGVNYGLLKAEEARLEPYMQVARILRSDNSQDWIALPREIIQRLLLGSAMWTEGEGRNLQVPPPEVVRRRNALPFYVRLALSEVILWALAGLFTEKEREVLATPR